MQKITKLKCSHSENMILVYAQLELVRWQGCIGKVIAEDQAILPYQVTKIGGMYRAQLKAQIHENGEIVVLDTVYKPTYIDLVIHLLTLPKLAVSV